MNKYGRPLARATLCLVLLSSLSGCVALVVGGVAAGAAAGADRRTLGTQADDKAISVKADMRLPKITGPDVHINVNSFNRQVLLTGEVKDDTMKAAVEREVKAIDGVASVANELTIAGPATYTARASDSSATAISSGTANIQVSSAATPPRPSARPICHHHDQPVTSASGHHHQPTAAAAQTSSANVTSIASSGRPHHAGFLRKCQRPRAGQKASDMARMLGALRWRAIPRAGAFA